MTISILLPDLSRGGAERIFVDLALGLPVVATDCPSGPAEILENGRWARLVPGDDADALSRAMDAGLSAPADRTAIRRRAADFAPEIAARKYLDLFDQS